MKRKRKLMFLVVASVLLVIVLACGSSDNEPISSSSDEEKSSSDSVEKESPTSKPKPTEDPDLVKPGTYMVGTDIQPGIYLGQTGTDVFDSCYWERKSDLSGELESINANENAIGQYYFEILETDYAVETTCEIKMYNDLGLEPASYPTSISPGVYLVGEDIQPGTYRGQAGEDIMESCYWSRLSDLYFEISSILANDNSVGQYYIEVKESDFAIQTACDLELVK